MNNNNGILIESLKMATQMLLDGNTYTFGILGAISGAPLPYDCVVLPYWEQFSVALREWTHESNVKLNVIGVCLPREVLDVLIPAVETTSFDSVTLDRVQIEPDLFPSFIDAFSRIRGPKTLRAMQCDLGGICTNALVHALEGNARLIKLAWRGHRIQNDSQLSRLAETLQNHPSIEQLSFVECWLGEDIDCLRTLLRASVNKITNLYLWGNGLSSTAAIVIAEFLSLPNPSLEVLDMRGNSFTDDDCSLVADALKTSNAKIRVCLNLNKISPIGIQTLRKLVFDESSLNAIADSNHNCSIDLVDGANAFYNDSSTNMKKKIFSVLRQPSSSHFKYHFLLGTPLGLAPDALRILQSDPKENNKERLTKTFDALRLWVVPEFFSG